MERRPADQALVKALDDMAGERSFAYEGTSEKSGETGVVRQASFEGFYRGPNDVYVRGESLAGADGQKQAEGTDAWIKLTGTTALSHSAMPEMNPQPLLEQLRGAAQTAAWGKGGSLLQVKLEPAAAKQFVEEAWLTNLKQMTEAEKSRATASTRLSEESRKQWLADIDKTSLDTQARLKETLSGMNVDMSCQLQLDPVSGLPEQFASVLQLQAGSGETAKAETQTLRFRFRDYGSDIMLPGGS
jgi:hypothetical protein